MIKKRIVSFTAVCSLIISVLISTAVPVFAKATGVPGKPFIDMSENNGQITSKLYIKGPANNAVRWRLYENNKIVQTGTATDSTPNSQFIYPEVFNRPSGQYTYRCELINEFGSTFSDAKNFTVSHGYIEPAPVGAVFTENFENGINSWTRESSQTSATGTIESGTGTNGTKCLKLSSTSVAANLLYKKTVTLIKGEKYRLTAYVKYNNITPTYSAVGPTISIHGTNSFSGDWKNISTSTGWEKMTLDFTASNASTVIAVRLGYPSSEVKGIAMFDNISIEHLSKQVFMDTFESGISSAWGFGWYGGTSEFKLDSTTGYNSSKSLKITSPNYNDIGVTREVSGFIPGAYYEISAYVKYSGVDAEITTDSEGKKHKGPDGVNVFVLYPDCDWIRSDSEPSTLKYQYVNYVPNFIPQVDLKSSDWKQIKAIFPASPTGTLKIGLRLGHAASRAIGTVWFDDIKVRRIDSELNVKEGNYIRTAFTPYNTGLISKPKHTEWISNLDQAYALIKELVGNKVPYGGNKIGFIETKSYPGGALVAGNPILWWDNNNCIRNALKNTSDYNDMGFGPVHEIGHDFNIGNSSWNWNDEMFTNFRMYYVVDQLEKASKKLNLTSNIPTIGIDNTYGHTAELETYYKQKYDESFGRTLAKDRTYNHDGLMYILIRIEKKTGWEPFYKTFNELNSSSTNYNNKSAYDRFVTFLTTLDKHTTVDVVNEITLSEFDVLTTQMK